jgi:hypothetical protein
MEIFSEEQNPADGREEDRESELPLEETTSHTSGPSEIPASMMDEPSSGIFRRKLPVPHTKTQNFIQESENLDILISPCGKQSSKNRQ